MLASVWLSPSVQVQVRLQSVISLKLLTASSMWTLESELTRCCNNLIWLLLLLHILLSSLFSGLHHFYVLRNINYK